ncbi:MAG: CHAT domain-containing protein [Acidobacteriota bacterium]
MMLRDSGDYKKSITAIKEVITPDPKNKEDKNRLEDAQALFLIGENQKHISQTEKQKPFLESSLNSYLRGIKTLELQTLSADFSETTRNVYKARHARRYREALAVGLLLNQLDTALHILERYRTQSLLDLLNWSRPATQSKIPLAYREELASIGIRYDRLTKQIGDRYPEKAPDLLEKQAELRRRREVIQGQIIAERRAEEGFLKPLDANAIRESLDPGTLMLAYSIGNKEDSHLFVVDREGPIDVHTIEPNAEALQVQVDRLRTIDTKATSDASRDELSGWLYDRLIAPAAERIAQAERVLILPDGPLHYLHFAALTQPDDDDPRGWRYLIEHRPIHVVQSASVYAELKSRRPARDAAEERPLRWVGVGNAVYPIKTEAMTRAASSDDRSASPLPELVRSAEERGIWKGLAELPHTQREIERIADQFPQDQTVVLMDRSANEDRVRATLADAQVAHFAVHGLAHPEQPMDSFLALSLLDDDPQLRHNGLLQAWEIVDHLQLDADLVVLSACESAIGPERRGEGLISVSRAFQVAGARSVLASLWLVNDASTAELMIRFYRHWLDGRSKDDALRMAQLELIRGPIDVPDAGGVARTRDFSAPRHWAAFQLIGDWQ